MEIRSIDYMNRSIVSEEFLVWAQRLKTPALWQFCRPTKSLRGSLFSRNPTSTTVAPDAGLADPKTPQQCLTVGNGL